MFVISKTLLGRQVKDTIINSSKNIKNLAIFFFNFYDFYVKHFGVLAAICFYLFTQVWGFLSVCLCSWCKELNLGLHTFCH